MKSHSIFGVLTLRGTAMQNGSIEQRVLILDGGASFRRRVLRAACGRLFASIVLISCPLDDGGLRRELVVLGHDGGLLGEVLRQL